MDGASLIQTYRAKVTCETHAVIVAGQSQIKSMILGDLSINIQQQE